MSSAADETTDVGGASRIGTDTTDVNRDGEMSTVEVDTEDANRVETSIIASMQHGSEDVKRLFMSDTILDGFISELMRSETPEKQFEYLCTLASELKSVQSGERGRKNKMAIKLYQKALSLELRQHRWWSAALINLGNCLRIQSQEQGDTRYLEEAIHYRREALALSPEGHPGRSLALNNLSNCLRIRYQQCGDIRDLEESVKYQREVLALLPVGHPDRPASLNNLSNCLAIQYEQQGNLKDLEEAIDYQREALALCPEGHPSRSLSLNNLANRLQLRYQRQNEIRDLEEAIGFQREAVILRPPGHPGRSLVLSNLASCLQIRYERQGDIRDLEESISYQREELMLYPVGSPDRSSSLSTLAYRLQIWYEQQGNIKYLEEAIKYHREALVLCPPGHPDRTTSLNNIANCLAIHYKQGSNIRDLDEAIQYRRETLVLRPAGHPDRATSLNNLSSSLQIRHQQQGDIRDLGEAISCQREALGLCPDGHPGRSLSLNNLANCLQLQYGQQGDIKALEGAIIYHREALLLSPAGHPDRAQVLGSLAGELATRYQQQNDSKDLQEAIQFLREELVLCPVGHFSRSLLLNNLSNCLQNLYQQQGDIKDLEEAINCQKEALSLYPAGHLDRPRSLNNLAGCMETQYKQKGDVKLFEETVSLIKQAIAACPPDHPSLATYWTHLAVLFSDQSHIPADYGVEDLPGLFAQATGHPTASWRDRFHASLIWVDKQDGTSGLQAYQSCLELADQYLLVRELITSRHQLLSSISPTLASDATAHAIRNGDIRKAVEFFEQGRTLLWSQLSRYRAPLDQLLKVDPHLAGEFNRLSQLLEASATSSMSTELPHQSIDEGATRYRKIAEDWRATVQRIQEINGFETFLQPPRFSSLHQASQNGPVIAINISSQRSDTIIIQKDQDPVLVPLPDIQLEDVLKYASMFHQAIRAGSSHRCQVLEILRALWTEIIQPVVDKLQELNIQTGSHIWLCPTSYLSMLPLHAAGPHRKNKLNLPDLYICSYTPSISTLLRSLKISPFMQASSPQLSGVPHLLLLAQPETPGQDKIPHVWTELEMIAETVPSMSILLNENSTCQTAMKGLKTHSWVHFSCHGSQNYLEPFKSSFCMHDGPINLLDIIKAQLPDAQYAFLSACHSAAGDLTTPNETIHLAAALQFSGFRSVIGTMYAMADVDGPIIAREVYKHLFHQMGGGALNSNKLVDYRDAAKALNIATCALKDNEVPVERWINFVHIGI